MDRQSGRPILACITAQSACDKIIKTGLEMARHLATTLQVVTVQPKRMAAEERAEAMKCLYRLSKDTGCEITVYYSDQPAARLARHALENDAMHIITGAADGVNDFVSQVSILTGSLPVSMVGDGIVCTMPAAMTLAGAKQSDCFPAHRASYTAICDEKEPVKGQ